MPLVHPPALLDAILDSACDAPFDGVLIEEDVTLRPASPRAPRQFATIYRPALGSATPAPALLWFHGGGFSVGHPNNAGHLAKALALALGVVTVSASYRLGSAAQPAGTGVYDDVAHAWGWLHAHADPLGLDPARLAVGGESAGCHLAGHLAARSPLLTLPFQLPAPAAWIACWGPLDFVSRWFDNGEKPGAEINLLGPGGFPAHPAAYHRLGVLPHLVAPLPPALFIYGETDPHVHPRQGRLGLAAWHEHGALAELLLLPNLGHGVVGDNRPQRLRALSASLAFAARHLA